MKATAWDKILTSAPLNADAAKARDGKGEHWTPEVHRPDTARRSHAPFPMKRVKAMYAGADITGLVVGKLRVVGLADIPGKSKKQPAAWVVRCVCGYYETRSAKALRSPEYAASGRAMCTECDYLTELKAGRVIRPTVAERMQKQKELGGPLTSCERTQGLDDASRFNSAPMWRPRRGRPSTADG
jgi:hypothetical protein